jgi:type II secretory pathway pseudopilin PulG
MKLKYFKNNKGYSLIETMIAISLFIVIILAGTTALLNANSFHQKSNATRSILDNLVFIMEEMSRNLRTGSNFYCMLDNNIPTPNARNDGENCLGISFTTSGPSGEQWLYKLKTDSNGKYKIYKSTTNQSEIELNSEEIEFDINSSGFFVIGSGLTDGKQPLATIKLSGMIIYQGKETPFSIRTSVSQRAVEE